MAQRERRCLTSTRSQVQILYRPPTSGSSNWLGHHPFKVTTRVRIPYLIPPHFDMPVWRKGIRGGLKIRFHLDCGFESHHRYHFYPSKQSNIEQDKEQTFAQLCCRYMPKSEAGLDLMIKAKCTFRTDAVHINHLTFVI